MTRKVELAVVGLGHHLSASTRHLVSKKLPMKVRLVREPTNEYDSNAIMVILNEEPYKKLHLGYIPKRVAEVYAPKLDAGKVVFRRARLVELDHESGEVEADLVKRKSLQRSGI